MLISLYYLYRSRFHAFVSGRLWFPGDYYYIAQDHNTGWDIYHWHFFRPRS